MTKSSGFIQSRLKCCTPWRMFNISSPPAALGTQSFKAADRGAISSNDYFKTNRTHEVDAFGRRWCADVFRKVKLST